MESTLGIRMALLDMFLGPIVFIAIVFDALVFATHRTGALKDAVSAASWKSAANFLAEVSFLLANATTGRLAFKYLFEKG